MCRSGMHQNQFAEHLRQVKPSAAYRRMAHAHPDHDCQFAGTVQCSRSMLRATPISA
jgi:hypothetical protein